MSIDGHNQLECLIDPDLVHQRGSHIFYNKMWLLPSYQFQINPCLPCYVTCNIHNSIVLLQPATVVLKMKLLSTIS